MTNIIMCSPLQVALLCGGMVLAIEALWYIVIDGVQKLWEEVKKG